MKKFLGFIGAVAFLCASLSVVSVPSIASGGGNGGGGSTKPLEIRVTGYVTAIDYVNSTITIGASYYGSGSLKVSSSTSVSLNNVSCDFSAIQIGDWAEARYEYYTKVATKLSCTGVRNP